MFLTNVVDHHPPYLIQPPDIMATLFVGNNSSSTTIYSKCTLILELGHLILYKQRGWWSSMGTLLCCWEAGEAQGSLLCCRGQRGLWSSRLFILLQRSCRSLMGSLLCCRGAGEAQGASSDSQRSRVRCGRPTWATREAALRRSRRHAWRRTRTTEM